MQAFDSALTHLQQTYKIAGSYWLSEFYKPGGQKSLFDFLMSVYQPEYQNDCRVVIVQDCQDIYDYEDMPGQAICELQKYASQIDISNFFILVVSGNKNIGQELQQVCAMHSHDSVCMQHIVVESIDVLPALIEHRDTFCALPWLHLYVGPDGNVLPCCKADHQHPMGNINEIAIDDIAKSVGFNKLRKNMLSGRRSRECAGCYQQEDLGIKSARQIANSRWNQVVQDQQRPDGTIDTFNPLYLDIRLNNICNLKCRMCSGYFSSAIAQEEVELFGDKKSIESSMRVKQRRQGLTEILEYLNTCEKIYFAGGEPLLAAEHYEIMDQLLSLGNTDLEIFYNTNFTTLIYRDRDVLDLWQKFTNIRVGASLDAYGDVAEYVRYGTNWKEIEHNLERVKNACPHVNLSIQSTVGLLNASSLMYLQKNWHERGLLHLQKFGLNIMLGPAHLTLTSLPARHKTALEQKILDHIVWCESNQANVLAQQWRDVLSYMWSEDTSHNMKEFKRLTMILDQHRHQSLLAVLPEYQDLL